MADYSLGEAALGTSVDLTGLRDGLGEGEREARSGAERMGAALSTGLKIGLGILVAGIAALGGAIGLALGEATEAQDGMAQLDAVIRSTGGAAGVTRDEVLALASSLSAANGLSKFSDDAVLAAENLLLTFTNIGHDVFPMATQAAIDMAQALGTEPQAQAIALGKALNDPVAGITALTRVGVTFTEGQKELIKSLVETGDVASAQRIILAELAKEFGGSAAAAAGTLSGQLITLQEQFNGILEGVGTRLIPSIQEFVGTLSSPAVMGTIEQMADLLAGALGTAIEWLASTALPALTAAWDAIAPAIQTASGLIQSVASDAFAWGQNIVISLANGISAAVNYVVSALGDVGSVIQYWLQPGSPPKLLPDLTVWGQGAASAYMDGWEDADLAAFDTLSGKIENVLRSMAAGGSLSEEGLIPAILGSREAVAGALAELERTGTISEQSFAAIRESAGEAGADVEALTRSYLALRQASEKTTAAQAELDAALDAEAELKSRKLIPVAELEAAKARVKAAKQGLTAAKDAEGAAKDQFDRQQAIIDQQIKTNALLQEQVKLEEQKAQAAAGKGPTAKDPMAQAKKDAEQAAKAQEAYNLSVASTDGKLSILRARLDKLNPSQAEYWQTLQQISSLEAQQAKEKERITQAAEADQKKLTDAQWAHEFAVASDAEKLQMLKDKLADLSPVQAEYWQTQTQITQLEERIAKAHESAAKGAGALGGATAASLVPLKEFPSVVDPVIQKTGLMSEAQQTAAAQIQQANQLIQSSFAALYAFVQPIWQAIADAVALRMAQIQGIVDEVMPYLELTIAAVLGEIQTFWEHHGEEVVSFVQTTWDNLGRIVSVALELIKLVVQGVLSTIYLFIQDHGDDIQTVASGTWMAIQGIVETVLAAIEIIISTALAIISGDWESQLSEIKATGERLFNGIKTFFEGVLSIIAGAFGTTLSEIANTWDSNFRAMANAAETVFGGAITWLMERLGELTTFWEETLAPAAAEVAKTFKETLKGAIEFLQTPLFNMQTWFNDIRDAIDGIIGRVDDFVEAIASVDIPDWLEGHSPPPLADWFTWSAEAAASLNAELPELKSGLTGATPQLGGSSIGVASASAVISFDDRGESLLRSFIRVEVREAINDIVETGAARGRGR